MVFGVMMRHCSVHVPSSSTVGVLFPNGMVFGVVMRYSLVSRLDPFYGNKARDAAAEVDTSEGPMATRLE